MYSVNTCIPENKNSIDFQRITLKIHTQYKVMGNEMQKNERKNDRTPLT